MLLTKESPKVLPVSGVGKKARLLDETGCGGIGTGRERGQGPFLSSVHCRTQSEGFPSSGWPWTSRKEINQITVDREMVAWTKGKHAL